MKLLECSLTAPVYQTSEAGALNTILMCSPGSGRPQPQLHVKEEETDEDEGEDLPDSLGLVTPGDSLGLVAETEDAAVNGLADFERTVSS